MVQGERVSIPRYPEYRDSGVEWLGQVPAHWGLPRLRFTAQLNPSKNEVRQLPAETVVSFLPMEAIRDDGSIDLSRERFLADVTEGYTFVRDGDVALAKITPCFENGKGAVMRGLQNGIGFGTTELIVVRPEERRLSPSFLHYLFTSTLFRQAGESWMYGAGGQKRVPDSFVRDAVIPLPSLKEQGAISEFLDRETAKIDALVAEQERLITLLKEKRRAVISHAVTKGLNPDAPMTAVKDNGFTIPSHWHVMPLNRLVRRGTTITYGVVQAGPDVEGGVPYIRTSDMSGDALREGEYLRTSHEIDQSYSRSKVETGDLVVAIRASVGKALIVPPFLDGANLTQGTARVAAGDQIRADFLVLFFQSDLCQGHIQRASKGTTFQEITLDALRKLPVAVPPIDEQEAIVENVNGQYKMIRTLHECSELAIEVLTARRAALITAAVTGQIDVRGLAPAEAA